MLPDWIFRFQSPAQKHPPYYTHQHLSLVLPTSCIFSLWHGVISGGVLEGNSKGWCVWDFLEISGWHFGGLLGGPHGEKNTWMLDAGQTFLTPDVEVEPEKCNQHRNCPVNNSTSTYWGGAVFFTTYVGWYVHFDRDRLFCSLVWQQL